MLYLMFVPNIEILAIAVYAESLINKHEKADLLLHKAICRTKHWHQRGCINLYVLSTFALI